MLADSDAVYNCIVLFYDVIINWYIKWFLFLLFFIKTPLYHCFEKSLVIKRTTSESRSQNCVALTLGETRGNF